MSLVEPAIEHDKIDQRTTQADSNGLAPTFASQAITYEKYETEDQSTSDPLLVRRWQSRHSVTLS
jgi:hypothetical protein